jgi:hypothetical protein
VGARKRSLFNTASFPQTQYYRLQTTNKLPPQNSTNSKPTPFQSPT